MYRHLLVPIDGTDLSTATISQAVEFARALGARITFFHAQPDFAASLSGDAEVVRLTAPADFVYAYQGRARELLTKAESAARAQGVPCASTSAVSDSPYSAIVSTAREAGCDLIYMASHGRKSTLGMLLGSQTLKVLLHSEIPVLVAATTNPPAPIQAIGIIREEHRSLAAVLHAWQHLLKTASDGNTPPDPALMRAMLRYIKAFPLALHHPKEDEYLFRRLRERTHTMNAELDELVAGIDTTLKELRTLMVQLSPPALYELGLGPAVEWLAETILGRHAIEYRVDTAESYAHLDEETLVFLFRAIREVLINIVKHAHATKASIALNTHHGDIVIEVRDDGVGIGAARSPGHRPEDGNFGLFALRDRIDSLGGQFSLESGAGTRITLQVPMTRSEVAP